MNQQAWNAEVELNQYGYYQLVNPPTAQELNAYYAGTYYQQQRSLYEQKYDEAELRFLHQKIRQKERILEQAGITGEHRRLLDVGCGEGFTLRYFSRKNWRVTGLDMSDYGCETHNPECLPDLIIGDLYEGLDSLAGEHRKFDVVWLDNILEHVLDPLDLVRRCQSLLTEDGAVVVEVPNDFSAIQLAALDKNLIENAYWLVRPDHISYFNRDGLTNLASHAGLTPFRIVADFPIDFALFNQQTNYVSNPQLGSAVHSARVAVEDLMHSQSVDQTNDLYEAMATMGLGRQIVAFFENE